jgi:hypothetical protein
MAIRERVREGKLSLAFSTGRMFVAQRSLQRHADSSERPALLALPSRKTEMNA